MGVNRISTSRLAKHPEYTRGFRFGHEAGSEIKSKYGRSFAEHQLDQLARHARRRGWRRRGIDDATRAFDHGYVAGYRTALA